MVMQIVGITGYISVEAELLEAKERNKRSSQNETSKEAKTSHKEAVPRWLAEALTSVPKPWQRKVKKCGVAPLFRFDMPCADASGAQDKRRPYRSAISKLSFDIEANCKERDVFNEALRKETKISK